MYEFLYEIMLVHLIYYMNTTLKLQKKNSQTERVSFIRPQYFNYHLR